jgi:hypothetical protein
LRYGGDPGGSLRVEIVLALECIVLSRLVNEALVGGALGAVDLLLGEKAVEGLTADLLELTAG